MNTHTKRRCLCPPPDYAELDNKFWFMQDKEYVVFDDNILHFKVATTECSRCGVPLCEDCQVKEEVPPAKGIWIDMNGHAWHQCWTIIPTQLCPVCAEEMR